jgi:DNA-binding GntR family transcriptional regulator
LIAKRDIDLATTAYEKIKQMIIDRELLPGEKIQQEILSKKLEISRTPLITALNRLQSEKLVESELNKGFTVRKFSLKELVDIWTLRTVIERMAIEEFAETITSDKVNYLRNIFEGFAPPWNEQKYSEYTRADRKFHNELLKMSNNSFVPQIAQMFDIVRWSYQDGLVRFPEATLTEHKLIIDALEVHDLQLSLKLITEHHKKSKECLEFALRQFANLSKAIKQ